MQCTCGTKANCKEGRGNNYHFYRLYYCPTCNKKFATIESKADYEECRKMIRRIHYAKYIKKPPKKKSRSGRRRNSE